ncbi:MAG: hypothetical protein AAAFM81_02250, partial [Pseudomonadota bacterium]
CKKSTPCGGDRWCMSIPNSGPVVRYSPPGNDRTIETFMTTTPTDRGCALALFLIATMLPVPALGDIFSDVASCRDVRESTQRLACYDDIRLNRPETPQAPPAAPATEATNASVDTPSAPAPPASPVSDSEDEFGKEIIDARSGPKSIESRIVSEFSGWRKGEVFELENGQQWVQTDSQAFRIRGEDQPVATIKRKSFGSYRMSIEGSNRSVRVRRIR